MCAAPGSKTEQMLQLMMLRQSQANDKGTVGAVEGHKSAVGAVDGANNGQKDLTIGVVEAHKDTVGANNSHSPPVGVVGGLVVANDADAKRVRAMCDRLYKRGGRGGGRVGVRVREV